MNRASQPILAKPDAASEAGSVPQPRLWDRLYSRVRPRRASATGDAARRATRRKERLLVIYGILAISGLIVLRATVDAVDFLSVGWILVLVALPLLPWLLPRLGDFLKAISPYVQSLKLGALQLDLRAVQREPVSVPSSGIFAGVPNDAAALSAGTTIKELVSSLRELRRAGAGPVGVIDLRDGLKWRLPNLYFLARLLELEPVISQLVFTEARGGDDGYVVGSCRPDELRRHIEQTVPGYASASRSLALPSELDLTDVNRTQELGNAFSAFVTALPQQPGINDDPARGWVTSELIRTRFRGLISPTAIDADDRTLSEEDVRAILDFPFRFVPATAAERLAGLIDREMVALAVARAALASTSP